MFGDLPEGEDENEFFGIDEAIDRFQYGEDAYFVFDVAGEPNAEILGVNAVDMDNNKEQEEQEDKEQKEHVCPSPIYFTPPTEALDHYFPLTLLKKLERTRKNTKRPTKNLKKQAHLTGIAETEDERRQRSVRRGEITQAQEAKETKEAQEVRTANTVQVAQDAHAAQTATIEDVNNEVLAMWDSLTPFRASIALKGFAFKCYVLKMRFACRTRKYAGLGYIPELNRVFSLAHLPTDVMHIYAQVSEDIGPHTNMSSEVDSITISMQILSVCGTQQVMPFTDFPTIMHGAMRDGNPAEMMMELAKLKRTDVFQNLSRRAQPPQNVTNELNNLEITVVTKTRKNPMEFVRSLTCFFFCFVQDVLSATLGRGRSRRSTNAECSRKIRQQDKHGPQLPFPRPF